MNRKIFLIPLMCVLLAGMLHAQPMGNEWIDYSKTYYKIKTVRGGIHRIPYITLFNAFGNQLNNINGNEFALYYMGQKVPIYVTTNGVFSSGDYIEFLGRVNDGSFDSYLFDDPAWQVNKRFNLFNDTAVFYLTVDNPATNVFFEPVVNDLTNPPPKEDFFIKEILYEFPVYFNPGEPTYLGTQPLYDTRFDNGEGFINTPFNLTTQNITLSTPYAYTAAGISAVIKPRVVSISNTPHRLIISFNSTVYKDTSFSGYLVKKYRLEVPINNLATSNTLSFTAAGTGSADRHGVATIEVAYPRAFNFGGNSVFDFSIEGNLQPKYLEITNFNDKGTDPVLFDITNRKRLTGLQGSSPYKFHLAYQSISNERDLLISSQHPDDVVTISNIKPVTFTNYANPLKQGNYIILTHPSLLDDGNGNNYVDQYRQYRSSASGGGYQVRVVLINELYDQFSYGIRKHPLAIRNFIRYAVNNWNTPPQYLLIIGKGRQYNDYRYNSSAYQQCLIPTFGEPGSDNLLVAERGSYVPLVAVGRLSVTDPDKIRIYLDKVKQNELNQNQTGDPYQTIRNKLWMKHILHLGGGTSQFEQTAFKSYLNSYKRIVEDTLFGGRVTSFFKTSSAPIQIAQSEYLNSLIDSGLSLITFFGHSSPNSFDYNLDNPQNYSNYGRYPLILSNGCFTGNIFISGEGISEQFVFVENKGAIGFLSTISLSVSTGLDRYSSSWYQNMGRTLYGAGIGMINKQTIADVEACCATDFNLFVASEMTLNGDPAVRLNPHAAPDYVIEPQMVVFDPAIVTADLDSFTIRVISTNIGRAVDDSIWVEIRHELPNETTSGYRQRIRGTYYKDTLYFKIPLDIANSAGLHRFTIKLDADDEVPDELSETNNQLSLTLNVTSDDVFPVYPYEFSIVPQQGVELKASTGNPFAPERTYNFEIDTTEFFNSPVKVSGSVTQTGGVVKWQPSITLLDSVVYYWRVRVDPQHGTGFGWHNSSFIYLDGSYPGWNQSHYFQYLKDNFNNLQLPSSRQFEFAPDVKDIVCRSSFYPTLPYEQIAWYLNNVEMHRVMCAGNGFTQGVTIAVINYKTGQVWQSEYDDVSNGINTRYGNIHCKPRNLNAFAFRTNDATWRAKVLNFLNQIPDSNYILIYTFNDAAFSQWEPALVDTLINMGASDLQVLVSNGWARPWIFFTQKGNPQRTEELMGNSSNDVIELQTSIVAKWYEGSILSPLIGPAAEWGSVHFRHSHLDYPPADSVNYEVIGVQSNGLEVSLLSGLDEVDTPITFIDAGLYPYIRLKATFRDDTLRTPAQPAYWRVLYKPLPDAAINPAAHFQFYNDMLNIGEVLSVEVGVENLTPIDMDSLLIKYVIKNKANQTRVAYVREDSLKGNALMTAKFQFNTACNCLTDINWLSIEINPDNDQPEQYHFNNYAQWSFKTSRDVINPLLDVTFDGVHILDGDIVSAKPEILIRLKDENKYLALDDTALINVWIRNPDGTLKRQRYDGTIMQFFPANLSGNNQDNTASILLKRHFEQDGVYELLIQSEDKSKNVSGHYGDVEDGFDYRISFEVINKASITNVMNYPNPFTTSTRFVFTLTGSEIPTYFKIQIMTVTGKIVREITLDELGPIHIGRNITEFAWDGTDQYGDPLANGLYLYRVVTSLNGQPLDHYNTKADQYFEHGFGKMYLAR